MENLELVKRWRANAIASQLGFKLLRVNYADIESKFVGETSKNLERLFSIAKEKHAVLLFDEADALLSKRVTDMTSATDVSVNQTRSVLLTLLDGYDGMVIFTTNFISNYDPPLCDEFLITSSLNCLMKRSVALYCGITLQGQCPTVSMLMRSRISFQVLLGEILPMRC